MFLIALIACAASEMGSCIEEAGTAEAVESQGETSVGLTPDELEAKVGATSYWTLTVTGHDVAGMALGLTYSLDWDSASQFWATEEPCARAAVVSIPVELGAGEADTLDVHDGKGLFLAKGSPATVALDDATMSLTPSEDVREALVGSDVVDLWRLEFSQQTDGNGVGTLDAYDDVGDLIASNEVALAFEE